MGGFGRIQGARRYYQNLVFYNEAGDWSYQAEVPKDDIISEIRDLKAVVLGFPDADVVMVLDWNPARLRLWLLDCLEAKVLPSADVIDHEAIRSLRKKDGAASLIDLYDARFGEDIPDGQKLANTVALARRLVRDGRGLRPHTYCPPHSSVREFPAIDEIRFIVEAMFMDVLRTRDILKHMADTVVSASYGFNPDSKALIRRRQNATQAFEDLMFEHIFGVRT